VAASTVELAWHVAARTFEEVRDRGFGYSQLFEVGSAAGTVFGACVAGVLWTIAVDAGLEFAESTSKDAAIVLAVVRCGACDITLWAALLTHETLAIWAFEFAIVPVITVSFLLASPLRLYEAYLPNVNGRASLLISPFWMLDLQNMHLISEGCLALISLLR
jgi:hypothetical protein